MAATFEAMKRIRGQKQIENTSGLRLGLVLFLLGFSAPEAMAQQAAPPGYVLVSVGGVPGGGVQVGYVALRSFYTFEGVLYASRTPPFAGAGDVQVAGGAGGALRLLGVAYVFSEQAPPYDLDLGVRLGPGFLFKAEETRADKNRRFRLFLEPFLRFAYRLEGGLVLFSEAGLQRPQLRAGLWLRL